MSPNIFLPEGFLPRINNDEAATLERMPSYEEIKEAVWSCCGPSKAVGYDELNLNFIKNMWDEIGAEISKFILDFFQSSLFHPEINMKDFRPISMVGCLYKIIAKILANRIKEVMPILVGETQTAFVHNRQILDNALIANEVVWWLKKRKFKAILLKLNFQKAYDTVRWSFLENILEITGFGKKWRGWIAQCLSIASMCSLINRSPTEPFKMERGLRQGDPLSPFLFVLVAEVFNRMVQRAKEIGVIEGIAVSKDKIDISHLQFKEDTLIFCPAKKDTVLNYRRLLDCFSLLSGLKINYSKSAIIPVGCEENWALELCDMMHCKLQNFPIIYLGIPLGANPSKVSTWKPVLDKIERRLALWKGKVPSRAGRLTLIKVVLNNMPTYYLSIFKIPKNVVKRIIKIQRNFFWVGDERKRGIPLVAWDVIQKPKNLGGLGVGDIVIKNAALLFKWWWKFLDISEQSLWINEGRSGGLWGQITNMSKVRPEVLDVVSKGLWRKVGEGDSTLFWEYKWIGEVSLKTKFPRLYAISNQKHSLILDMGYWDGQVWCWTFRWRREFLQWERDLFEQLLNMLGSHPLVEGIEDSIQWKFDSSGSFTVKSFVLQVHNLIDGNSHGTLVASLAWKGLAPPRAEVLVWFVLQERLNTRERLCKLNILPPVSAPCPFCQVEVESVEHLFFGCLLPWSLWTDCLSWWGITWCCPKNPASFFQAWCGVAFYGLEKKLWVMLFYVLIWSIWNIRNRIVFENMKPDWEMEKRQVKLRWGFWMKGWMNKKFYADEICTNPLNLREWRFLWRSHN